MSKLRKERWKILKHVFENLKQLAETEGNAIYYDGENYSEYILTINDTYMTCGFVLDRSWHGIYDYSEQDARTSATSILEEIKDRIKVYKLTNIW